MERRISESLRLQNAAASMMTEMPESRCHYESDGLPLEAFDPAFHTLVDLEKILHTLWHDLHDLNNYATITNRYSENYLSLSRELENLTRKAGSLCLTREVLKQQGCFVSCPDVLNIPTLTTIAGYHFNKAHAAVSGTGMRNIRFYLGMLGQETRWASLLCRLKATADKIRLIREGKLEVRVLPEKEADTQKQNRKHIQKKSDEKASVKAAMPASLPLQKDLVRAEAGADVQITAPAKAEKAAAEEAKQDALKTPEISEVKDEVSAETGEVLPEKAETQTFTEDTEISETEPETAEPKVSVRTESEETIPAAETAEIIPAETKPKKSALERYREEFRKKREAEKANLPAEQWTPLITEEKHIWEGFSCMREPEFFMDCDTPPEADEWDELEYAPMEMLYA